MKCVRRFMMSRFSWSCVLGVLIGCGTPLVPALVWAEQTPQHLPAAESGSDQDAHSIDTPHSTAHGHRFVVPAGWALQTRAAARILNAPEAGTQIALLDVEAADADAAVAAAWELFDPEATGSHALKSSSERMPRAGWTSIRSYLYVPSDGSERLILARAARYGTAWNVVIIDAAKDVAATRESQIELLLGSLSPKGYVAETFAGKTALPLDETRTASLRRFIESARVRFAVPGVAVGIVQNGQVVMAEGMGVRALGKSEPVNAQTLFMIASNTKALTTLLLAKLVDAGTFSWDTPVIEIRPDFRLGDAQTTRQVQFKHLVCACTGLPRQDMEWIFEGEQLGPDSVLPILAAQQPSSAFGALYQYSNLMAGAAGYIAGHVAYPQLETGAAYDRAMRELVFDPLGMSNTTFDHRRARSVNHAAAHALDFTGKMVRSSSRLNLLSQVSRPDGGAWSNVEDLLRYVQMELDQGQLPDGSTYIAAAPLLARREPQVSRGKDLAYGMGLKIDHSEGTTMVHHGGSDFGFISDMLWLPEHKVGAVILINAGDGGIALRNVFRRRLLELLFDGEPHAAARIDVLAKDLQQRSAEKRAQLRRPVPALVARGLAARYRSAELGTIEVSRRGPDLWFDFGSWKSEVALGKQADGAESFVSISAAIAGFEFIPGHSNNKRTLLLRDDHREYVFEEDVSDLRQNRSH